MSISICQNVVEPIAQQFARQPVPPVPSEGIAIPQQVLPCPRESIVTRKLVKTRSLPNLKMPLGKTFIVPRGTFGPERAKDDGGTLFEMVQKHQNGYISQKAMKQLMAKVEATGPCNTVRHVMPGPPTGDVQSIASSRRYARDGQNMATSKLDVSSRTISTMCPTPLGSVRIPVRHAGSLFGSPVSAISCRPVSLDSCSDALSMVGNSMFASRPMDSSSMVCTPTPCQSASDSCAGVSTVKAQAAGGVSSAGIYAHTAPAAGGSISISMTRQEDTVAARRFDRTQMQAQGRLVSIPRDKVHAQVAQGSPGVHVQTMDEMKIQPTMATKIQPTMVTDRSNESHSWEDEFLIRAKLDTTVVVHPPMTVSAQEFAQSSGQIVSSPLPVTAGHTSNISAGQHG